MTIRQLDLPHTPPLVQLFPRKVVLVHVRLVIVPSLLVAVGRRGRVGRCAVCQRHEGRLLVLVRRERRLLVVLLFDVQSALRVNRPVVPVDRVRGLVSCLVIGFGVDEIVLRFTSVSSKRIVGLCGGIGGVVGGVATLRGRIMRPLFLLWLSLLVTSLSLLAPGESELPHQEGDDRYSRKERDERTDSGAERERIVAGHGRSSQRQTRTAAAGAGTVPAPIAVGLAATGSLARVNRGRSSCGRS